MRNEPPRHGGRRCDGYESHFLAESESRYLLFVVACRAFPRDHAVFPSVPRTFDVFARDRPLTERATLMVAPIPDRVQLPIVKKDGNRVLLDVDRERCPRFYLFMVAEDVPGQIGIHMLSGLRPR